MTIYAVSTNINSFPKEVVKLDDFTVNFDVKDEEAFQTWWSKNKPQFPLNRMILTQNTNAALRKYTITVINDTPLEDKIKPLLMNLGMRFVKKEQPLNLLDK